MSGIVTESDGIQVNLPIGLTAEGDLGHLPCEVALVDAAEDSFGIITFLVSITQVKRKDWFIQQALVNHVVKGRDDLIDGDRVKAQTKDAVKATKGESKAGFACCLSEVLLLDLQVTNLQGVLRDETAEAAGAISDRKLGSVLLVCRRCGRIVLVMEIAGDGTTLSGWNPEIGATGVKDDFEPLRWRAKGNLRVVYNVKG